MKSLQSLVNEQLLNESIIPELKKTETTLYDLIKDNIKNIVYKRQMGYTHYMNKQALKNFIKDSKINDDDMFVTTKGKKPTAPEPLQQLFVILTKCIVIPKKHKNINLKEIEVKMSDILKLNGIYVTFYLTKYYFCMMIGQGTECNLNFDDTNSKMFGY